MRVAVLHPQTAFVRGGAETHAEALVRALKAAGHEADLVQIAGKWYPASQLAHQMAVWRSFDITESNGLKVDAVIALKFPAYLIEHERKIVWLIHQHRTAYELWDHPEFADLSRQDDGAGVRDMVWNADRLALNEAKRVFTNSKNVQERLWSSLRIPSEHLYHPSGVTEHLLDQAPGPYGDYLLFPSRMESLKRQSLVIDAMTHVRSDVKLVLVGRGPDEPQLRERVDKLRLKDKVRFEIGVSDDRLHQLYLGALAVYFGPFDEDYGYVTLEGFAAERPVVTLTDSGGPLEFVADGETGFVVPARAQGRSPRRSTGCSATTTWPPAWARPATRSSGPRCRAGPTSSRGCSTDGSARSRGSSPAAARARSPRPPAPPASWSSLGRSRLRRPASRRTTARCSTASSGSASWTATAWTCCGRSSRRTPRSSPVTGSGSSSSGTTSSSTSRSTVRRS